MAPGDAAFAPLMAATVRLLLISGSLRDRSTTSAALRTAEQVAPEGVIAERYDGLGRLPHFNPDDDGPTLPPAVVELRHRVREADGLLFSTPEYAGALPGSFKNLLDWLIGDDQPRSIYEKPVAWINASPRGARLAHDSLRAVLDYAHARVVEDANTDVGVSAADIGPDGTVAAADLRAAIAGAMARLATAVVS